MNKTREGSTSEKKWKRSYSVAEQSKREGKKIIAGPA